MAPFFATSDRLLHDDHRPANDDRAQVSCSFPAIPFMISRESSCTIQRAYDRQAGRLDDPSAFLLTKRNSATRTDFTLAARGSPDV